jgi:hypothetical protein
MAPAPRAPWTYPRLSSRYLKHTTNLESTRSTHHWNLQDPLHYPIPTTTYQNASQESRRCPQEGCRQGACPCQLPGYVQAHKPVASPARLFGLCRGRMLILVYRNDQGSYHQRQYIMSITRALEIGGFATMHAIPPRPQCCSSLLHEPLLTRYFRAIA